MIEEKIIKIGKMLYDKNLTVSTSGNISVRTEEGIYITATGTRLGNLNFGDIVLTDFDGNEKTNGKASSEKKLHVEIYKKRADVNAIIHVHPLYLSSFAACAEGLTKNVLSESVLYFEDIPVAPYYMPSSIELAKETVKYFADRDVVIMSNHGATAVAGDIDGAFEKMETAEYYAHVVLNTKIMGNPKYLTEEEINDLKALKSK